MGERTRVPGRAVAVALLALFSCRLSSPADADPGTAGTLVILLPGLAVEEVNPGLMPNLARIAAEGTVALVNAVSRATFAEDPARWDATASGALTLGTGGRGWSPPLAYAPAGVNLPPAQVARMRALNRGGTRAVKVGFLGEALRRSGGRAAALGCADDRGARYRAVILAAMDMAGAVGAGDVTPRCLLVDEARPYAWISDPGYLLGQAAQWLPTHALVWIDPGDLERAERYAPLCVPTVVARHRRAALAQADRLIAGAAWLCARHGATLVVLAPVGRQHSDGRRATLTPLVRRRAGEEPGLLYSGSTRRAGLVANTDLAAWLVAGTTGTGPPSVVRAVPRPGAWQEVTALAARVERADRWRGYGVRVVQLLLLVAALLGFAAAWRHWSPRRVERVATLPLLVFAAAWLATPGGPGPVAMLYVLAVLGGWAWRARRHRPPPLAGLYGGLAAGLLLELGPWGKALDSSVLGYSLALGARYYGIGNEWMGVITGASLAALLLARDVAPPGVRRAWPFLSAAALLVLLLLLGLPVAGADLGGALTAGVAAAALVFVHAPPRWRGRLALLALLAAGAALGLLVFWDALRPPEAQTHLGRLLDGSGDVAARLGSAIRAKLALNWRVAQSLWGLLILAATAASWAALKRAATPPVRSAAGAFAATALAALLLNDSGATAAALLLASLPGTLLLITAEERPGEMRRGPGPSRPAPG